MKLNKTEEDKIIRFLQDPSLSGAVYKVLLDVYTSRKDRTDVHLTAGQMIAIDLLHDAWKELEKIKHTDNATKDRPGQIGL